MIINLNMKMTLKVGAVIFNRKNEVLLIKEQYRNQEGYKWNLVKGTFDRPNETIEDCIKREIGEEVGLKVKRVELKNIYHYGEDSDPKVLFVFHAYDFEGQVVILSNIHQNIPNENIIEIRWFQLEEIKTIPEEMFMSPYVFMSLPSKNEDINKNVNIKKI